MGENELCGLRAASIGENEPGARTRRSAWRAGAVGRLWKERVMSGALTILNVGEHLYFNELDGRVTIETGHDLVDLVLVEICVGWRGSNGYCSQDRQNKTGAYLKSLRHNRSFFFTKDPPSGLLPLFPY
jgi:hypothetical protein